jgi:hypothetical protein
MSVAMVLNSNGIIAWTSDLSGVTHSSGGMSINPEPRIYYRVYIVDTVWQEVGTGQYVALVLMTRPLRGEQFTASRPK